MKAGAAASTRKRRLRPSANAVTARDVAHAAGVSVATVSRVLNSHDTVAEELRERVNAAAATMGYTPHAAAQALASQRTRIIGAIIPTLANPNFSLGVEALQQRLGAAGYTLLLANYNYDLDEELRQAKALAAHGVAGVMLIGARHRPELYQLLDAKRIPFVNTWALDSGHPCVGFDNHAVGAMLANYLLDLGHTEFGVIAQLTTDSDRSAARVAGVHHSLARRGVGLPRERLVERTHSIVEGQLALRTLMDTPARPTAVICGTDILAFGALVEARQMGIAVPGELSIAGINDAEFAMHMHPPLTTVRLPADEMGARAADYLIGRVEGRPVARTSEVQVSLIVRASTAPPPTSTLKRKRKK